MRLLHYWLKQRGLMSMQPEPFALAEFEIHRVVAEASGNPFLRAATALSEFGVASIVLRQLGPALQPPAEGLAGTRADGYFRLVAAIEAGDAALARQIMSGLLSA